MKRYLLVFDRSTLRVLHAAVFAEAERVASIKARFAAESQYPGKEVVVINAPSWAMLKNRHSRYFRYPVEEPKEVSHEAAPVPEEAVAALPGRDQEGG